MENGPRFVLRRSRSNRGRLVVAAVVGSATVAGLSILGVLLVLRAGAGSGVVRVRGDALAQQPGAGALVPGGGGGGDAPPGSVPTLGAVEDPRDASVGDRGVVTPAAGARAGGVPAEPVAAPAVAAVAAALSGKTGAPTSLTNAAVVPGAGMRAPPPPPRLVDKTLPFNVTEPTRPPLVCRGVLKFPRTSEEGWYFCDAPSLRNGLVYTIGVGRNIRWDEAMIKEFNTTHHGFDPTPRSTSYFLDTPSRLPPGFFFHTVGLGVKDGELAMELPDGNTDSFVPSALGLAGGKRHVTVPVRTLSTLLASAGHTWVDVLKVDIEGAEGNVIQSWADAAVTIPADQVLLELHGRYFPGVTGRTFAATVVENMRRCGFVLFYQIHYEYSFVRANSVDAAGAPVAEFNAPKKLLR